MLNILRYLLTAPTFLGWLFPLLMCLIGAAKDLGFYENGVLAAEWRPWVTKFWKYSTTLSRGIVFQPGVKSRTVQHELVHVRQAEDCVLLALSLGVVLGLGHQDFWLGLGVWVSGPAWQVPNFFGAILRGGHVYRDAEHERAAYSITNVIGLGHVGKSWLEIFEEDRILREESGKSRW